MTAAVAASKLDAAAAIFSSAAPASVAEIDRKKLKSMKRKDFLIERITTRALPLIAAAAALDAAAALIPAVASFDIVKIILPMKNN
jgi:hypothetical protein